jgi:hypothetical protein
MICHQATYVAKLRWMSPNGLSKRKLDSTFAFGVEAPCDRNGVLRGLKQMRS